MVSRLSPLAPLEAARTGLLWPSIATLAALAILLALGTWQWARKAWKEDLISKIEVRSRQEPALIDAIAALRKPDDDMEYTRVRAQGRFIHEKSLLYYASGQSGPGYHLYTPFETVTGKVVLINRGFIPEAEKAVALTARPAPEAPAEIAGLIRNPGGKGWFTPSNDVERNIWYSRDLTAMAAHAVGTSREVFPFYIEELARPTGSARQAGEPLGGATRLEIPNRHFEYALTWYGFALGLIGVYLAFAWSRWRSARERSILGATRRRGWGNS